MPKIRIKGFDSFLRGLSAGLDEYNAELKKEYKTAVESFAGDLARTAAQKLARLRLKTGPRRGRTVMVAAEEWCWRQASAAADRQIHY